MNGNPMTTSILFLCPHNAAKSVAAAAFTQSEAQRVGVAVSTDTAGTDPDSEMLPIVAQRLAADGHDIAHTPRMVSAHDLDTADIIINIGCNLDEHATLSTVRAWSIPNFSDDASVAFAALESHVQTLVAELAQTPD